MVAAARSLALAIYLGFGLPAEKLLADEEGDGCADREGQHLRPDLHDADLRDHDALQAGDQISGGKEEGEALYPCRQHG